MNQEDYQQVKKIFQSVVELAPEKRADFLEKECGENGNLRREVESLLNAADSKFLEEPAMARMAGVSIEDESENETTKTLPVYQTGNQFGHYRIISKIGQGGIGEVFLAEDTKLGRKVAIKFLSREPGRDPDKIKRFLQEARAASALNHPNILTVYEIGEEGETNYIAAEYIEGETLRRRLRKPHSVAEILDISIQMAEGLAVAHQAGIIHRDIKPDNVMIRQDGLVKILDFGLAKLTETRRYGDAETRRRGDEEKTLISASPHPPVSASLNTEPGIVMGTPNYMSPEQARGKVLDEQTDIFSFGIVFYEMLAGRLPFEGETFNDIMASILTRQPLPLTDVVNYLPGDLERISRKALQKEKAKRYWSVKDLLDDLKDVRDQLAEKEKMETAVLPETIFPGDFERISAENNKDALLLTEFSNLTGDPVFDGTLKLALAVSLEQSPYLHIFSDSKIRQTLPLMGYSSDEKITWELGREICLRKGLKAFVTGTISKLGTVYVLTLEAVNAQTDETIGRQLEQVEAKEEVIKALGKAATGLRETLGESLSSIRKFDAPLEEATTSLLGALKAFSFGFELMQQGRPLEAIPYTRQAIEIDPKFAFAYWGLAVQYMNTRQPKKAAEFAAKAFELCENVSQREKFQITVINYVMVTGEIEKAIEELIFWKQTYPREHLYATLSHCYGHLGQFEKALDVTREGIRADPKNSIVFGNLAFNLLVLHRFDESKKVLNRAFELKIDADYHHIALYWIAFIEEDEAEMQKQIAWFGNGVGRHIAFDLQAGATGFRGQWRKSKEFSQRAIASAIQNDISENAATYCVEQALRIVFWSSGKGLPTADDDKLKLVIKTQINKALRLERFKNTLTQSALALAFGGLLTEAGELISELAADHPKDTVVNKIWLPTIKAAIELQKRNAEKALKELEIAESYERAGEFYPQYIRGLAYQELNENEKAEREFQKILDHRGESPLSALYPLAHLGKARATNDGREYEKFFELWKDADEDMPALIEAKKEYVLKR